MTHVTGPGSGPDLLDLLRDQEARPGDPGERVREIVATIAGDPLHERDRIRVVSAILSDGLAHSRVVDPNRVRRALTNEHGLMVYPRVLSAMYSTLTRLGHLKFHGWVESDDVRGRNAGKPARTYLLVTAQGTKALRGAA